ncbi:MAG: signal peptidase II [Oscillospiraceae bacterium]|nr:signal peptidase II [Oscillospiraceae bacterium]
MTNKYSCICLSFVIILIDQIAKFFVRLKLKPSGHVTLIDNLLELTYAENKGAAFGIFSNARWFFVIFTTIMMFCFIFFIFKKSGGDTIFYLSSSLIVGGGVSNLIDRIWLGYVIDYLELSFFSPICNFADYCITFGAVLFALSFAIVKRKTVERVS